MIEDGNDMHYREENRIKLGISKAELARRGNISLSKLNAILSGIDTAIPEPIASLINCPLPEMARFWQARKKAKKLVAQVQGTMALEGAAVDQDAKDYFIFASTNDFLEGSDRNLWYDI